jgi:CRISPR-associated protein Cas5t
MSSTDLPKYSFYFDITSDFAHFRDIFTHSFFKTLLAPPRTTVIGIIGAAMGIDEKSTIELSNRSGLYIGINILLIKGIAKEIIHVRNLKGSMLTETPTLRTLIVSPVYRLYIASNDEELLEKIRASLYNPVYPLYLGISEFLAKILNISNIYTIESCTTTKLSCVVPFNNIEYSTHIIDNNKLVFLPEISKTVYSFKYTNKGREPEKYINLLMSYNCELRFENPIQSYHIEGENICLI